MQLVFQNVFKDVVIADQTYNAISDFSFTAPGGVITSIYAGYNSGKSTLYYLLACLEKPSSGFILLDDLVLSELPKKEALKFYRKKISTVHEYFNIADHLTVSGNLKSARKGASKPYKVKEILTFFNLEPHKLPRELSNLEKQILALACALIRNPNYLICDHPTFLLNESEAEQFLVLLEKVAKIYDKIIIFITDDHALASKYQLFHLNSNS